MKFQSIHLFLSITLAAGLVVDDTLHQRRQQAQPTLPSNYWWPYASTTWGGATTSTVPATTVTQLTVSPTTTMVVSVSSQTVSSGSTSLTTASSTSESASSSSSASSSVSDVSTTTTDPQQTNPTSYSHVSRLSIPIIASIAGGIVGVVVLVLALLLCRCCTRRRREHTTRRTLRRRRGDAEKGWGRISIGDWEDRSTHHHQQRSWWNKLFSTHSEEVEDVVVPGPRYVGVDEQVEGSAILGRDELRVAESDGAGDDLLLIEKPRRSIRRPNQSLSSHQPLMPSRSTSTTALVLAELDDDDDDDEGDEYEPREQVPWESLRHKSIKRAILAKVDEERKWTDSMRGVRAANANAAKNGGGVGRRQTHVKCDSDFWVSSASSSSSDARDGGFRIVAESPPQIPVVPRWTSLASLFSTTGADEEDRYTPVPARMRSGSKSRSRNGSITSPGKRTMNGSAAAAQVLLRSPPTVMSPEMESALCFTPLLTASMECAGGDERVHDADVKDSAGAGGTAFTKTYRLRTDRALRRVEAIVESGWTERGVATRIRGGVA